MSKAIEEIVRFQTDRNLDKMEYHALNEHGNIVEELLESIGLDVPKVNRPQLKEAFETFVNEVKEKDIAEQVYPSTSDTPKAEQVDAYVDMVVFAIGAIMKLGYDADKALIEGGKEINSRVGTMVDGKFEKDLSEGAKANWYKADYDGLAQIKGL